MQIPGYTIEKELGKGGMATVYLALQNNLDRQVALKVMSPQLLTDPSFTERFLREAKIIAQLSHPHIIPIYDVSTMENRCYIAMEYQQGGELNDKLKAGLSLLNILTITKEIATALSFAHEKGYIHRDVKPANILFNNYGKSILSDFGVARQSDSCSSITAVGSVVGTPLYMSPEQVQGKNIDHRSDLYSLAVVLYEMLSGVPPYPGETAVAIAIKHMTETIPLLPIQYAHLQFFINKALDKDPENRYQSGTEFILALDKIQGECDNHPTATTPIVNQDIITQQAKSQPSTPGHYVTKVVLVSSILLGTLTATGFLYFKQTPVTEKLLHIPIADTPPNEEPKENPEEVPIETPNSSIEPELISVKNQKQEQINILLARADQLMSQNILTAPQNPNAHTQYLKVLKLDPNNHKAQQNLRLISENYLHKIPPTLQQNQFKQANKLLEHAISIYPQHADIEKIQNQIKSAKQNYANDLKKRAAEKEDKRIAAREKVRLKALEEERKKNAENEILRQKLENQKRLEQLLQEQNLAKIAEDKQQALKNEKQKVENDRLAQLAKMQAKFASIKTLLEQPSLSVKNVEQAYNIIRQIRATDQSAELIKNATDRVINAYVNLSETALEKSNHDRAEKILNKGLAIKNNDPRLRQLQSAIEKSRHDSRIIFGVF